MDLMQILLALTVALAVVVLVLGAFLVSVSRQLDDARRSEKGSRDEQLLRLIAEFSPVHMFRADQQGAATFVSPSFTKMTGLGEHSSLGMGWTAAVHPDDRERLITEWHESIRLEIPLQVEFRFRTETGLYRWFRLRVVPRRMISGKVTEWIGAAIDFHELTEALEARALALAKAEDERRVAEEASQLKDEFLATASHELRTPLNAIMGWVHVMKGSALEDSDRQHAIEAIERNARIQTRLVEDLLDESRMAQGRVHLTVAPLDLRAVIESAVESIRVAAAAKQIELRLERDQNELPVMGDGPRLQQAVCNLLVNSVKYTPNNGVIGVAVRRTNGSAELRVRDSGEGIDKDFLPFVFEPFRQGHSATRRAGFGLGLAIVRRLVDLHGGQITAMSEGRGHGAEFVMTLPIASARAVDAVAPVPLALQGLRVLLAEDDADSAASVTAILAQRGCEARTAYTAGECLRILGEWLPDVVLCDVGLPDDDGYNLLRRIRALPQSSTLPAIALTAFTSEEDKTRAMAAGFRTHMSKPLEPELLLREISAAARTAADAKRPH